MAELFFPRDMFFFYLTPSQARALPFLLPPFPTTYKNRMTLCTPPNSSNSFLCTTTRAFFSSVPFPFTRKPVLHYFSSKKKKKAPQPFVFFLFNNLCQTKKNDSLAISQNIQKGKEGEAREGCTRAFSVSVLTTSGKGPALKEQKRGTELAKKRLKALLFSFSILLLVAFLSLL